MFGAFFYSYCPVFIITSHLLFFKAHFPVKPNASLLGKICSPAGRRVTTWPCLGIPKKSIAGLAIFSLKKINIWAGYLAWARRATARPVNSCSDVFVVFQRRKTNIWAKHRSRKTLQCSHLKNTNTARAAWSQLLAAPCAILSFIDYIGWQWCGTVMSGNQEEAKKIVVHNKEALAYVRLWP